MKFAVAALLGYVQAVSLKNKESPDCPSSQEVFSYNERVGTATGFLQLSACSQSGINGAGLSCVPDNQYFATGMNGDEDLGEDIIMKGKPFHYDQKPATQKLFATGMNGDEDLGEDIIMKGKPFHYDQKPSTQKLFATGMNGDEDLGEDIIMKGKPFHYNQQKPQQLFATGMNGDEDLGEDIIMKGKPFHYNQQKPQ